MNVFTACRDRFPLLRTLQTAFLPAYTPRLSTGEILPEIIQEIVFYAVIFPFFPVLCAEQRLQVWRSPNQFLESTVVHHASPIGSLTILRPEFRHLPSSHRFLRSVLPYGSSCPKTVHSAHD